MRNICRWTLILAFIMTVIISQCSALILTEDAKLTASDAAANKYFGVSVAMSEEIIVVGAYTDDDAGIQSGSAYVYVPDGEGGWTEITKLTASDAAANKYFGRSVAVSGETIVVGAYGNDDAGLRSGSAYVYVPDGEGGWKEITKLTASDAAAYDWFGRSVAVSGETIVVGAYGRDISSGSAYVYVPDGEGGWKEIAKLTASDAAANKYFGRSVAVSGETIVVGAYGRDISSGSAYVYVTDEEGGWTEITKLTASDAAAYDWFGKSVAVSGETIVVGAYGDDTYSGSAYVYVPDEEGEWTEITKLTASDAAVNNWFGRSVAMSGETIVVGAYTNDDAGIQSGSAYVYVPDGEGGWTEITKLTASDAAAYDWFGVSVAVSGETFVVGAYGNDDAGPDSGSAYVYDGLNKPPVAEAGGPYNVDEGNSITLDGTGSIDPDGDPITYEWDLDNDGIYEIQAGTTGTTDITSPDGPDTITVALQVSDGNGGSSTDTATITVNNVASTLTISGGDTVDEGSLYTLSLSFSDPGKDTISSWTIDWGDGNTVTIVGNPSSANHTYADGPSTPTISATATDEDGTYDANTLVPTVNNVAPTITSLTGPIDPVEVNTAVSMTGAFTDQGVLDTHTATFDCGDGATESGTVTESGGSGTVTGTHTYTEAGMYTVTLTVEDDDGDVDSEIFQYVVVYDSDGGFVTGGGWINSSEGAYKPDSSLTGKTNFGFVSKYKKGAEVPIGQTKFHLEVADLNFHSDAYDWLVVAGPKAMYKGIGTINGEGSYGFMLSAIDEELTPSTDVDMFRIKIWDKDDDDVVVYDNQIGDPDDADLTTTIGGGSIKIHKG